MFVYFDNYGQEYDTLRCMFGEDEAFARYSKQQGRLIIVEAREDNATRLFIQSLYDFENMERKTGWWNTFTICDAPQKAGLYIAQIRKVRQDKKGYPNFIAHCIMELDISDICKGKDMWEIRKRRNAMYDFLKQTGVFTEYYHGSLSGMGYNTTALYRKFNISEKRACVDMCETVMFEVALGNVTLKEIVDLLLSPTDEKIAHEKYVAMLREFVEQRGEKATAYPYLVKKLNRMIELDSEWQIKHDIEHIMFDFVTKYDHAVYDGHIGQIDGDDFDKAEVYLKFDAERKAKKAAAKKAAKKAKKNAEI